jgi:hypothetical protein
MGEIGVLKNNAVVVSTVLHTVTCVFRRLEQSDSSNDNFIWHSVQKTLSVAGLSGMCYVVDLPHLS